MCANMTNTNEHSALTPCFVFTSLFDQHMFMCFSPKYVFFVCECGQRTGCLERVQRRGETDDGWGTGGKDDGWESAGDGWLAVDVSLGW